MSQFFEGEAAAAAWYEYTNHGDGKDRIQVVVVNRFGFVDGQLDAELKWYETEFPVGMTRNDLSPRLISSGHVSPYRHGKNYVGADMAWNMDSMMFWWRQERRPHAGRRGRRCCRGRSRAMPGLGGSRRRDGDGAWMVRVAGRRAGSAELMNR